MTTQINTEWKFKLLAINTGRTFEKSVVGFDSYEDAADCAKSCVPVIHGPVIVLSYI